MVYPLEVGHPSHYHYAKPPNQALLTWAAVVAHFEVDGQSGWTGGDLVERVLGNLDMTGAPARTQPISQSDDVCVTAHVTAAILRRRHASSEPHAAVESAADDYHFVLTTRRMERLSHAVLVAFSCTQSTAMSSFLRFISAICNIYISRLCYDVSVRLSGRLSVTEVHWRIIANLGFKFRSQCTAHCGRRVACGRIISRHASQC